MNYLAHIQDPIYQATTPWTPVPGEQPMGNQQHVPVARAEHVQGKDPIFRGKGATHWHFNDPVFGMELAPTRPAVVDVRPVKELDDIRR